MRLTKSFYVGSFAGGGILALIFLKVGPLPAVIVLGIYAGVVALIMWYKAWKAIQNGHARTTPGKAIGFLFIPFYNFYWIFQAYWGFAKDYNSYISRHEISTPKLPEGLFLACCIVSILAGLLGRVPTASFVFSAIGVIIGIMVVIKVCDAVNSLPTEA